MAIGNPGKVERESTLLHPDPIMGSLCPVDQASEERRLLTSPRVREEFLPSLNAEVGLLHGKREQIHGTEHRK